MKKGAKRASAENHFISLRSENMKLNAGERCEAEGKLLCMKHKKEKLIK